MNMYLFDFVRKSTVKLTTVSVFVQLHVIHDEHHQTVYWCRFFRQREITHVPYCYVKTRREIVRPQDYPSNKRYTYKCKDKSHERTVYNMPIKGSRRFLGQDIISAMLSTGWFQERIRA